MPPMEAMVQALRAHALLLALVLPPAIRLVGHWLPEEPLMVAMGILAQRSKRPEAAAILGLLWLSNAATDHVVFGLGRVLAPRLGRWPRVERRLRPALERAARSRWTLAAFVPARVLPLGRGAWLAGFGVAGVPISRFAPVDVVAVAAHLVVWCGLGWWLGANATDVVAVAGPAAAWAVLAAVAGAGAVMAWRRYGPRPPSPTD
jgi:membrane protein DedA with SNARE-associated domain